MDAFRSEYRLVGQEDAEYDFRDFRWAKLERLRRGARSSVSMARDEALLEYKVGAETAAPTAISSPRLDAMDVRRGPDRPSETLSIPAAEYESLESHSRPAVVMDEMAQDPQLFGGPDVFDNLNQDFPLDWTWLLGESGPPGRQSGDPAIFWNQLQQI